MDLALRCYRRTALVGLCIALLSAQPVMAAALQGPADASRIRPEEKSAPLLPAEEAPPVVAPTPQPVGVPKNLDRTPFTLHHVQIEGETAFSEAELADIYTPYLEQTITLETVYEIAAKITDRYREKGYFLSVANVMDRDSKTGTVRIKVTEGYIGQVIMDGKMADNYVVRAYIDDLKSQKPIRSQALESFLLRLNDIPGLSFRAVLGKGDGEDESAVKLTLIPTGKEGRGAISFDNYGSRFLGPNEVIATYSTSLAPLTQTTVTGIATLPADEMKSGTLEQTMMVAPDLTLGVNASYTDSEPGYTLEAFDIQSKSTSVGFYAKYQWLRQRQENLSVKLGLDGRHSTTDILGVPFTRDDVRAVRASASFDRADSWAGMTTALVTVSQGIDGLGSSHQGDLNLSRAEAKPDFRKIELSVSRLQNISTDWSVMLAASGQLASGPLYSSEEFGYGGQSFGRAYDSSEITGDHGASGSAEIRYGGWENVEPVGFTPYAFYDAGVVWNDDVGQPARDSGMSVGGGVRVSTNFGMTGNLGVAFPLTRTITAPIYDESSHGPRVMLQVSQNF